MNAMTNAYSGAETVSPARRTNHILRGLILWELRAQQKMMKLGLALWVVGVGLIMFSPVGEMILVLTIVYAAMFGVTVGGRDTLDGTGEFAYAMPGNRRELFRARFYAGCLLFLPFHLLVFLTYSAHLPGLTRDALFQLSSFLGQKPPQVDVWNDSLFASAWLGYGMVFFYTFSFAVVARNRIMVLVSPIVGILSAMVFSGIGIYCLVWITSGFSWGQGVFMVILGGVFLLLVARRKFLRSEAIGEAGTKQKNILAVVALIIGVILLLALIATFA